MRIHSGKSPTLDDGADEAARQRAIAEARSLAMHLAWKTTGKSLQQIGRYFGGRDHSTVLHSCRKIEKLTSADEAVQQTLSEITERLEL